MPAILEYIPYRKNDATAVRDAGIHPYLAGYGYASVRVDVRGTGDSEGVLLDEYSRAGNRRRASRSSLDSLAQPWCTGAVGMIGKSWGGFNALQIAAHAPPELQAVISVCSTDDRYADDVHYIGGCVFGAYMLSWASTMLAFNARPPDPAVVGERWRELWLERLEQHASLRRGVALAPAPRRVLEAGLGLRGLRRDPLPGLHGRRLGRRLLERDPALPGRLRGAAEGPDRPVGAPLPARRRCPGRRSASCRSALRWWDQWLKGTETGIMEEPMLRVWMQDPVPPRPSYAERPGRWVAEPAVASAEPRDAQARAHRPAGSSDEPGDPVELALARLRRARPRERHLGRVGRRPSTSRPTSGARTAARSASRRRRSTSASSCWASRRWRSRSPPTGRARWSRRGSATWRRTARRRWSRPASSTSPTARATSIPQPLVPGQPRRGDVCA